MLLIMDKCDKCDICDGRKAIEDQMVGLEMAHNY